MSRKIIKLSNNKTLEVYDDLFSYDEKLHLIKVITQSLFRVNGADSVFNARTDSIPQIYSSYSEQDLEYIGILKTKAFGFLHQDHKLLDKQIKQVRINLSPPSERNLVHTDQAGITFLYYPNLEWKLEWGGHTLFLNEKLDEAEYTCLNVPGRVVVFDGTIPHMVMTPTMMAPVHRYSFAIQFSDINR